MKPANTRATLLSAAYNHNNDNGRLSRPRGATIKQLISTITGRDRLPFPPTRDTVEEEGRGVTGSEMDLIPGLLSDPYTGYHTAPVLLDRLEKQFYSKRQ